MDASSVALRSVEIPIGVATSMSPEALIPALGPVELSLVPSFAVNDHDRILLADRTHESQLVVMKPVIEPVLLVVVSVKV
jgi:hypothetical protein